MIFTDESRGTTVTEKISQNIIRRVPTMEEIKMENLWENNPVVIIFFRRFGCMFCRHSAKEISQILPALRENGVKLVGIGMDPLGLEEFCTRKYFSGELYLDPSRENYKALGLKKIGFFRVVSTIIFRMKAWRIYKQGLAEGIGHNWSGDEFQSGGAIFVSKGGSEILYSFKQDNPVDFVSNSDILKSLGIENQNQ